MLIRKIVQVGESRGILIPEQYRALPGWRNATHVLIDYQPPALKLYPRRFKDATDIEQEDVAGGTPGAIPDPQP